MAKETVKPIKDKIPAKRKYGKINRERREKLELIVVAILLKKNDSIEDIAKIVRITTLNPIEKIIKNKP